MIWDGPTSSSSKCWFCFGSFPQRQPPLSQGEHAMDLRSPLQWHPCNCDKKNQQVGYFGAIQMYPDVSSCRGLNPYVSNSNLIVSRCIQYPSISMNIVCGDHCLLMDHSCSTAWWIKIDWAFSMLFLGISTIMACKMRTSKTNWLLKFERWLRRKDYHLSSK